MPLYIDRHNLPPGMTAEDLTNAHMQDEAAQEQHGVKYLTYWLNEAAGKAFCLVDAPSADAATAVHRESHGLVADKIIEVDSKDVSGYLGASAATVPATQPATPQMLDSGVRTILFTDIEASTAITQRIGDAAAMTMVHAHDTIVRTALDAHQGTEVKHMGDGIMACFASAVGAVQAAIDVQSALASPDAPMIDVDTPLRLRIGLSAGEPVAEHEDLFGAAVQLASRVCNVADAGQILVSNVIRDLCIGKEFAFEARGDHQLKGFDEAMRLFEVRWQPPAGA